MEQQIPAQLVVAILKDELNIATEEQKVALRRVLHEIRYVAHCNAHAEEPPTWVRKGDARIGQMGTTTLWADVEDVELL